MTVRDEFLEIAEKYGLEDKVAIHIFQNGNSLMWTLHRIIHEEERNIISLPLPEKFVRELEKKLVSVKRKLWEDDGGKFIFNVGEEMTKEDIREYQAAWNLHCSCYDR